MEQGGTAHPTNQFTIEIERLGPGRPVRLALRTILGQADAFTRRAQQAMRVADSLAFYIEGAFLYRDRDQLFERSFVCPIETREERSYTLGEPEDPSVRKRIRGVFNGQPARITTG
jgi:hypothetical protein